MYLRYAFPSDGDLAAATYNMFRKFGEHKQTNRQTDTLMIILRTPIGGGERSNEDPKQVRLDSDSLLPVSHPRALSLHSILFSSRLTNDGNYTAVGAR